MLPSEPGAGRAICRQASTDEELCSWPCFFGQAKAAGGGLWVVVAARYSYLCTRIVWLWSRGVACVGPPPMIVGYYLPCWTWLNLTSLARQDLSMQGRLEGGIGCGRRVASSLSGTLADGHRIGLGPVPVLVDGRALASLLQGVL